MNRFFDEEIRTGLAGEPVEVPEHVHQRTERLLAELPEKAAQRRVVMLPVGIRRTAVAAACFLFMMLVALPNVSVAYAQMVEEIPVVGKLVQVLTVRNYFYSDDRHELTADIPGVTDADNAQASDLISRDVESLTQEVVDRFRRELEQEGYGSVHIAHETVTNTPEWFTLKLTVEEVAASGDTRQVFYHIDRTGGSYVKFGDLFDAEAMEAMRQVILSRMEERMAGDAGADYWMEGENFAALDGEQGFYFAQSGELVVVYDEFEVAPGYMGCPEFSFAAEEYEDYIAPQYRAATDSN